MGIFLYIAGTNHSAANTASQSGTLLLTFSIFSDVFEKLPLSNFSALNAFKFQILNNYFAVYTILI